VTVENHRLQSGELMNFVYAELIGGPLDGEMIAISGRELMWIFPLPKTYALYEKTKRSKVDGMRTVLFFEFSGWRVRVES
jgi:hypothetical protein